jgi:hypothetical protein
MPVKKTIKAPVKKAAVKETAPAAKQAGLLTWFFVPEIKQGLGLWFARAGLFVVAMLAAILSAGALGVQVEFLMTGGAAPSFWSAVGMILEMEAQKPVEAFAFIAILYAIGMFVFMPRKYLDKTSFVATLFTFTFWTIIFFIGIYTANNYLQSSYLLLALAVLLQLGIVGLFASIACYARKMGVSRTAAFLSFPFAWAFFEYSGLFLPGKSKDRMIALKYKWYERFISFLLNSKRGQLILAAVIVAAMLLSGIFYGAPWEAAVLLLFGLFYFWKKSDWMAKNIARLAWAPVVVNIATISLLVYFFEDLLMAALS